MGAMGKVVLAVSCLAALAAFAMVQVVLGYMGLAQFSGTPGAMLGVAIWLLLGWRVPLQTGAFWGALCLWRWPWFAALLFAAPRELLMIPGLVSRWIARCRHPPPVWRGAPVKGRY